MIDGEERVQQDGDPSGADTDLVQRAPALELGEGPLCGGSQACNLHVLLGGGLDDAVGARGGQVVRGAGPGRAEEWRCTSLATEATRIRSTRPNAAKTACRRSSPEMARASARLFKGVARGQQGQQYERTILVRHEWRTLQNY